MPDKGNAKAERRRTNVDDILSESKRKVRESTKIEMPKPESGGKPKTMKERMYRKDI